MGGVGRHPAYALLVSRGTVTSCMTWGASRACGGGGEPKAAERLKVAGTSSLEFPLRSCHSVRNVLVLRNSHSA